MKYVSFILLLILAAGLVWSPASAQKQSVKLEQPVLLSSCGQSPGPLKIKVFFGKLGVDYVYNLQASAPDLAAKKKEAKQLEADAVFLKSGRVVSSKP